jgi:hypothetical protein
MNGAPEGAGDRADRVLWFDRDARLFATRRVASEELRERSDVLPLVPDELLHLQEPCDLVVRRGNLRLSEFLADGREVTRAVLQTGAVCCVRLAGPGETPARGAPGTPDGGVGDTVRSPLYSLQSTVLMALGETELWLLPAGSLAVTEPEPDPS